MGEEPSDAVEGPVQERAARSWGRVPVPAALAAGLVVAGVGFAGVAIGKGGTPASQPAILTSARGVVSANGTITVTGSGTVQGTPDTVSFQIGVQSTETTATGALADNNSRVAALETTLMKHGVLKKDMQTSGLNINENTYKGVLTGFSVDDELNVSMQGIANAGGAIEAGALQVGNGIQLYGISFSISNQSGLLAAARSRAMRNARTEAGQLAAGAGASLGGIVRVTDQQNPSPGFYANQGVAMASAASLPLQAGRQPVSVQVTVVYSLKG